MEEEKLIPVYFKKDNTLITSKSKMTLLGRKTLDLALMRVKKTVNENGVPVLRADFSGQDIREITKSTSENLYKTVKELIAPKPTRGKKATKPSLLDWRIIVKDDEGKSIEANNIITQATFKNGKMSIVFNNELENKLIDLGKNYTIIDRQIISNFSSNYSYVLYQIFKQTIDIERARHKENGPFVLEMDLIDLKVQTGHLEAAENDILYDAVMDDNVITYDAIESIPDKEYLKKIRSANGFKRDVVEAAQEEINRLSDIYMEYEPIKRGRGGKTRGFRFYLKYKDIIEIDEETDVIPRSKTVDIDDFIDELRDITENNFKTKELKLFAEDADYDVKKIENAYGILKPRFSEIREPVGFMRDAIRKGYEPSKKRVNNFNNFEQNSYDFDDLERKLLDN